MERKEKMPMWVFLGLMSIETRKGALVLLWSCILFGIACIPMMFYFSEWVDWTWVAIMVVISSGTGCVSGGWMLILVGDGVT